MLAGHRHESVHLVAEQNTGSVEHLELRLGSDRRALRMDLSAGRLHELRLPPCSYRMGTHWVGFGAAILDPDRVLTYGVLWSPDRLLYLAGYLVVLFVCAVLCLPAVWQLCGSVWRQLCPGKPSRFYGGSFLPTFHWWHVCVCVCLPVTQPGRGHRQNYTNSWLHWGASIQCDRLACSSPAVVAQWLRRFAAEHKVSTLFLAITVAFQLEGNAKMLMCRALGTR